MTINNLFEIGQFVWLKTDTDKLKRIVVSIQIHPNGALSYHLACGKEDEWHHEFEITNEKNSNPAGFKKD